MMESQDDDVIEYDDAVQLHTPPDPKKRYALVIDDDWYVHGYECNLTKGFKYRDRKGWAQEIGHLTDPFETVGEAVDTAMVYGFPACIVDMEGTKLWFSEGWARPRREDQSAAIQQMANAQSEAKKERERSERLQMEVDLLWNRIKMMLKDSL
jgi:hypothetical protein